SNGLAPASCISEQEWDGAGATLAAGWQALHDNVVFTHPVLGGLIVGGYAQILASAFAYLGRVLRGGGHSRLSEGLRTTRSYLGLIAANFSAVALIAGAREIL